MAQHKWRASLQGPGERAAASSNATVKSAIAWAAAGSPAWMVPCTVPGGKPVTAVPGLTPRSPVTWEAPVLVTVDPARTAKLADDPRDTGAWAAAVSLTANIAHRKTMPNFFMINRTELNLFIVIVLTFAPCVSVKPNLALKR